MEFIADLPVIGGFLSSAIAFVIVLGVVVFVHEYGHYIVGRWCGIHADTFSLGFGPRLMTHTDKRGTQWQIAALPLGGYVKFVGDADGSSRANPRHLDSLSAEDRDRSFHNAAVWKRSLTVLAGPVANFILSAVVFGGLILWQGQATSEAIIGEVEPLNGMDQIVQPGDRVLSVNGTPIDNFGDIYGITGRMDPPGPMSLDIERDGDRFTVTVPYLLPPLVASVEPLTAASAAGLKPGDLIRSIGGTELVSFEQLRTAVLGSGGMPLETVIERDGDQMTLTLTPQERERLLADGTVTTLVMIGVSGNPLFLPMTERPAPWTALWLGVVSVVDVIDMSLTGLGHIITGALGADNLQGPIGIAQISGESAAQGGMNVITLIAVISTAIGMLNLFPIPVLDGGHLVMFGYEAVRGKPPAESVMRVAMTVGLGMVLLLMVFATYNDIMRIAFS